MAQVKCKLEMGRCKQNTAARCASVPTREEVIDEAQEQGDIIIYKFRQVHVPQCSHQHERFAHVRRAAFQAASHDQY